MARTHKYNLAILIVLYNKEIEESITVRSLIRVLNNIKTSSNDVMLCIWNNGPKSIKCDLRTENHNTSLVETLNNESLSVIYNTFIKKYDSEKYLLLDHDTEINYSYLEECVKNSYDYMIPTIVTNKGIQSPRVYDIPSYTGDTTLLGIGSGICISNEACKTLSRCFGDIFDERFYLYGVDSTFFLRLNKIGHVDAVNISKHTMLHSLSRLEKESDIFSLFRKKERSYDQALTLMYYFSRFTAITVFKKIIGRIFLGKSDIKLKYFIAALIRGRHYKSPKS